MRRRTDLVLRYELYQGTGIPANPICRELHKVNEPSFTVGENILK